MQAVSTITQDVLAAFESVPDLYLILSPDLYIQTASNAYLEATCTKREAIKGCYLFDIFPANASPAAIDFTDKLSASLLTVLTTKQVHHLPAQHYHVVRSAVSGKKEKEAAFWRISNTPVLNEAGCISYIIHKLIDATALVGHRDRIINLENQLAETQQKAETLRKEKQWLEAIFNSSTVGVVVLKSVRDAAENIVDLEYILGNKVFNDFYKTTDQIEKSLLKLFPGTKESGLFQRYVSVIETGVSFSTETYYNFDNLELWLNLTVVKLEDGCVLTYEDITARKKAEEETRKGMETWRALVDNTPDIILRFNPAFKLISANAALEKELGTPTTNLLDKAFGEQEFPAEITALWTQKLQEVFNNARPVDFYTELPTPHNRQYYHVKLAPEFAQDKKVVTVLAIARNITEQKLAEEKIKNEHRRLKEAQQIGQVGSFEWNIQTRGIIWSDEMYRLYGLEEQCEEITLTKLERFCHPDDLDLFKTEVQKVIQEGQGINFTHRIIRQDGSIRYVHRKAECVKDEDEQVCLVRGTLQDVTEIVLTTQGLQESNKFIQQIMDSTPDILYILDAIEGRIVYVNREVYEILGYDENYIYELGATIFKELLHPDDYQKVVDHFLELATLEEGEVREIEYRIKDSSGNWCWFRVRNGLFGRDKSGTVWQVIAIAQHITAHKETEEKLKEEHYRLNEAQRIARLGNWQRNLQTDEMLWSNELYRIYDVPVGTQLTFEQVTQCYHPDDKAPILEAINTALTTDKPFNFICRIIRGNGDIRYLHSLGEVHRDSAGIPVFMEGTTQDITETIALQQQLTEKNIFIETLLDTNIDRISALDKNLVVTAWNRRCEEIYGLKKEAVIGKPFFQLFPKAASIEKIQDGLLRCLAGEFVHLPKQEDLAIQGYSDGFFIPLKDENNNVTGVLSLFHDITELVKKEQKLQESQYFIKKITDSTPDLIHVYDLTENKLVYMNRELSPSFGLTMQELLQMDDTARRAVIYQEDYDRLKNFQAAFATAADEEVKELEYRIKNIKGEIGWFLIRGKVFKRDATGKVIQYIALIHDITVRKRLEKEALRLKLKQQQEILHAILQAQESERERIGESLHNGLGQVLYASKLNLDTYINQLAGKPSRNDATLTRVRELLEDSIKLTRNISFELTPVTLRDLGLDRALHDLVQRIAPPAIKFNLHIIGFNDRLPSLLELAIFRIIQELINNILKYAQASEVIILLLNRGGNINIHVDDNGMGYDAALVASAAKGIGLSSIRNRIKLLKGTITIDTAPGQGTSVAIKIPLT
ncbi:PAS domain S-box protein [Adhaeribacter aquaticus]|uniref:PAS domain S-box protein n=1 Tax=Adhaeribacter aquaticus TaxID=299567 RepID=UPI000415EBC7|nr:PAS domain S-box protein [Adhaeribacter aquaticus]